MVDHSRPYLPFSLTLLHPRQTVVRLEQLTPILEMWNKSSGPGRMKFNCTPNQSDRCDGLCLRWRFRWLRFNEKSHYPLSKVWIWRFCSEFLVLKYIEKFHFVFYKYSSEISTELKIYICIILKEGLWTAQSCKKVIASKFWNALLIHFLTSIRHCNSIDR